MKKYHLAVLAITCVLAACSAKNSGEPSNHAMAALITKTFHLQDATVEKTLQSYPDSYRSPGDTGTTYVVQARITDGHGVVSDKSFNVFVAKADGWEKVEPHRE